MTVLICIWWLWLLIVLLQNPVLAALTISPPQLTPDEGGVVVTQVQSSLSQPARWSVRLVRWTADSNGFPPADGQVSPRFFSLQPGEMQVIRAKPLSRDSYHRLVIEQIPTDDLQQGLSFQFRFSLPVFRTPQEPARVTLDLSGPSGCQSYRNERELAVQVLVGPEVSGTRTLLPGQASEFCQRSPALKTSRP